mmetsp:Transcript_12664/g.29935  ORF Transcript_12664/g.29935 Transcript_12664/m.29935 type:complete len:567 (+) Transcript_12664:250-1950(+)|eukprot:CAMPEP_0197193026 /NCGR_PEP_ID=MMETSP1423-20130617/26275_1 /TAXON_ID=476441 /ORGANISM="Pseudo-nitzschia heimii, Strain UNC1101" /LENGTH=566 /DNA_ID=CAMNT_0042646075 /DNA_START=115 /DNA_END=1815 /DNA_ORIENTATION=+
MIDKQTIVAFFFSALLNSCDAFSCGAVSSLLEKKTSFVQREQNPLRAFASDRGETITQYEHFAISSDPSSPSTLSQESTTTPLAPPPIARPTQNSKLAMVDKSTNDSQAYAQSAPVQGEGQPLDRKQSIWERTKAAEVQGGSLRTWSFANQHKIDMIQVHMRTDGRPMNANVELWQGPDNVPQKVALYVEDGRARPFRCFVATPHSGNSISIRNTNTLEYPLQAILEGGKAGMDDPETQEKMQRIKTTKPKICQGGAVITERFEPEIQSIQVFLQSEGRPLQCRIELIQGPNNVKQVMEVYTEEGSTRPFYAIMETPGYGTGVVRIINSSTLEFPFSATIQPWDIGNPDDDFDGRSTGGSPFFEVSGGPEGIGIGNKNLRSVGSVTDDMGGMFGSFAISGSSSSFSAIEKSQGGGIAGSFESSASVQSPSPAPPLQRKMISPKKSLAPSKPDSEALPSFEQNEEFVNSSLSSSLSQNTTPNIPTTTPTRKSPSRNSITIPKSESVDLEADSETNLRPEKILATESYAPSKASAPQEAPVTKRYVSPSTPPPQKSSHVFLDIDDAFK